MKRHLLGAALILTSVSVLACQGRREPPPGPRSVPLVERPALAEADRLRRTGRGDEAVEAYRRAVDTNPQSVPARGYFRSMACGSSTPGMLRSRSRS